MDERYIQSKNNSITMSSLSSVGGKYANHDKEFDDKYSISPEGRRELREDIIVKRLVIFTLSIALAAPLVLGAFALPFVVPG